MASRDKSSSTSSSLTVEEINEILEQYDNFIQFMARKNISRTTMLVGEIAAEIDELAQNIRIKLWKALEKREIQYAKSYIGAIAHNEQVNMLRKQEPITRIITNEDGELPPTCTLVAASQEVCDPTQTIEEEEMLASYSCNLPKHVVKLPPKQRHAMICALKEQVSDLLALVDMFQPHGIDVDSLAWPEEENERLSSRVSLSVARKKLRTSMRGEN